MTAWYTPSRPAPFYSLPGVLAWLMLAMAAASAQAVDHHHSSTAPYLSLDSADGRYTVIAHCDGWLYKYAHGSSTVLSSVRVGEHIHTLTLSGDGRYLAVANIEPPTLVLLDSDLVVRNTLPVTSHDGLQTSHVSAIYAAAPRQGFVAILDTIPEVWEISTDPHAREIPTGFIHDYRMREGMFIPGYLNPRRTLLTRLYPQHTFNEDYSLLKMASPQGDGQVISLDARKRIADLPLANHPHLAEGIVWQQAGEPLRPCAVSSAEPTELLNGLMLPYLNRDTGRTAMVIDHAQPPVTDLGLPEQGLTSPALADQALIGKPVESRHVGITAGGQGDALLSKAIAAQGIDQPGLR